MVKFDIKKVLAVLATLVVLLFLGIQIVSYLNHQSSPINLSSDPEQGNSSADSIISDYGNVRELVGISDNVFVAKIGNKIGSESPGADFTASQFEAEVIFNIKGSLEGTVVVSDFLNAHLLQSGVTYVLTTRYNPQKKWYAVNTPPGATPGSARWLSKIISTDPNMTNDQLKELAKDDPRVQELLIGYVYEIKIQYINAANTFQSLSQKEKDAVLSKIKNLPLPPPTSPENTVELCSDKIDNDEDHFQDLADNDCKAFLPSPIAENTKVLCSDHLDNNRDGRTDLRDPDCAAFTGSENSKEFCSDGMDNDLDSWYDSADPDCAPFYPKPAPPPTPIPPPPPPPTSTSTSIVASSSPSSTSQ